MKKSVAVQHLKTFMVTLQKHHSNVQDPIRGPGLSIEFLAEIYPWVFGEKCPLPQLQNVLDRYDSTGELSPQDYYNLMTILDKFMYEIKAAAALLGGNLPEDGPRVDVLMGWDEEDES